MFNLCPFSLNVLRLHSPQFSLCLRRLEFPPGHLASEQLIEFFMGPASSLGLINSQIHAGQGRKAADDERLWHRDWLGPD
jgi:hypothetical protein